jgi:hypothetical protein
MSVAVVRGEFLKLAVDVGREAIHALYPNEFEFYSCAFELTDSVGKTLDMLIFPVMPNAITESSTAISNIKKTAAGVVVLTNPTFIPVDIDINGTFGRMFRFMLGRSGENADFTALLLRNGLSQSEFSRQIKTGYGVCKVLEKIIADSYTLDNYNATKRLYFYNLALNHNYLVEVQNLVFSQNKESNMMWQYSVKMKGIAPINQIIGTKNEKSKIRFIMTQRNVNKFVNESITTIKNQLPATAKPINIGLGVLTALL